MRTISICEAGTNSNSLVGNYNVVEAGGGVTLIDNYECDEVVYVDSVNISKLKYMGYSVDGLDIVPNSTHILHRQNIILHSVKPMQSIGEIANIYSTTADKIIKDNNLSSHKLFIGQILVIY